MLRGMIWRRLEGGDWYVEGGYFVRFGDTVWWAIPVQAKEWNDNPAQEA